MLPGGSGKKPVMLVLGHETRGVNPRWLTRGQAMSIPIHAIQSLGVAAAAAIFMDRLARVV